MTRVGLKKNVEKIMGLRNFHALMISVVNRVIAIFIISEGDKFCGWNRHKSRMTLKGLKNDSEDVRLTLTLCSAYHSSCLVLIFSRPIVVQPHQDLTA